MHLSLLVGSLCSYYKVATYTLMILVLYIIYELMNMNYPFQCTTKSGVAPFVAIIYLSIVTSVGMTTNPATYACLHLTILFQQETIN